MSVSCAIQVNNPKPLRRVPSLKSPGDSRLSDYVCVDCRARARCDCCAVACCLTLLCMFVRVGGNGESSNNVHPCTGCQGSCRQPVVFKRQDYGSACAVVLVAGSSQPRPCPRMSHPRFLSLPPHSRAVLPACPALIG